MSTITREWLQKAISQNESMRDEIPFGWDEDDINMLAAMKLALASLEAEDKLSSFIASQESLGGDFEKVLAENIEELYVPGNSVLPEPVVVPDYPETLPCPVVLEPGLRFGKGVKTHLVLEALKRRAEYYAELEAMTPEQRAEHDAGMKEFAAMLQGADGALTNEDTKRVGELVMWIKRLAHSLRKANPDSKLQSDAMDYLSRKGLIGVEDILR